MRCCHKYFNKGWILRGMYGMPYAFGSQFMQCLPDAFGTDHLAGMNSDMPTHIPGNPEMLDE